jgi:hypothetical protein
VYYAINAMSCLFITYLERDDLLIKSLDVSQLKSIDDLQRQIERQKFDYQQQCLEVERLKQALVERDTVIERQDQRLLVDHETDATQTVGISRDLHSNVASTDRLVSG